MPVVGDKSFIIAARRRAFVAPIRREIAQIPDEFAPEIWTGFHLLPMGLVIKILIFLGMIRAGIGRFVHRIFAVLVNVGSRAILADSNGAVRISGVEIIRPRAKIARRAVIPAEVFIEGEQLGIDGGRVIVGGICRCDGRTGGIFLRGKLGKLADQIGGNGSAGKCDLIENAPEKDGGMIIFLADHLGHLLLALA